VSFFICIASKEPKAPIEGAFPPPIELQQATNFPIGRSILAPSGQGKAYLVTVNGCSMDLMGRTSKRKSRVDLFTDSLTAALAEVPSMWVLVHWTHGDVSEERIALRDRQKISLDTFLELFPNLEEDVRYTVLSPNARSHIPATAW